MADFKVSENSRYARTVRMVVDNPDGTPAQPPWFDLVPRLRRTDYPDNRVIAADASTSLPNVAVSELGNARLWWVLALMSGVVDPFTEVVAGSKVVVPTDETVYFDVLSEDAT